MLTRIKQGFVRRAMPIPVMCRHSEYSIIASVDDDKSQPSPRLLSLSLQAIGRAMSVDLSAVSRRLNTQPYYPDVWPGEHYKLLAALVEVLRPRHVVEIGTFRGLSALALLSTLSPEASLATFDLIPWNRISQTCLREEDFRDGRMTQHLGDLGKPAVFETHKELLRRADLIFMDGPKDGYFEGAFLQMLRGIRSGRKCLLVLDDIRQWNMLCTWRDVPEPKLDLTSFGHWTGTGLIDWQEAGK